MITDDEKERVKKIRDSFLDMAIQMHGEDVSPELKAEVVGTNMASVDALFAIHEGESWRGLTDPKEIARAVLRQSTIGD